MALDMSSLRAALPALPPISTPIKELHQTVTWRLLQTKLGRGDLFRLRRVCRFLNHIYSFSALREMQYQAFLQAGLPKPSYGLSWEQRIDLQFPPRFANVEKLAKVDLEKRLKFAPLDSWKVVSADCRSCVLASRLGHEINVDITKKKPVVTYTPIPPFEETPAKTTLGVTKVDSFQFSNGKLHEDKRGMYVIENGNKAIIQDVRNLTFYTMQEKANFTKVWTRALDEEQLMGFVGEVVILQGVTQDLKRRLVLVGTNAEYRINQTVAKFASAKSDHLTRLVGSVLVTVNDCTMVITDLYCGLTTVFEHVFKKPVLSYVVNNLQIAVLCGDGKVYYAPLVAKKKG